jgi:hypothetical protein
MTDHHTAYIITLDKDIKEDDAEILMSALMMIKGVISVSPVISDIQSHVAEQRANLKLKDKLINLIQEL